MADTTGIDANPGALSTGYRAARSRRPDVARVVAAVGIVAAVGLALWTFGRSAAEPVTAGVVSTTEIWLEGQPFGAFEIVEVPAELSARFVSPNDLTGLVAATRIPPGSLVAPQMLTQPAERSASETQFRVAVDSHLWPDPGPAAGAVAVFAIDPGGCAFYVAELVDGQRETVTLQLDAARAAELVGLAAAVTLLVWESPPEGWHGCDDSDLEH